MCIIPNKLRHQLYEEHLIHFAQHVHLLHEGDILVFQKASIGFGSKHYNISMFIIPKEIHHHLHDELLHLIVQHVHLLHEDDILVFQKYFHWIWLKKLDLKCMHHTNYMMNISFSLLIISTYSMKMISCYSKNTSIGFGLNNDTINICIIPNELLHQLHDEHLLLLAQHGHLLHEDDILVFRKYFYWIWLEK